MSITKDVPVPTSYRRLHESKIILGIHDRLMLVWVIFISITAFSMKLLYELGFRDLIYHMLVILIFSLIVLAIARDVKTLDKNKRHIILLFRIVQNKHITAKYIESLDDLKKTYPIETVEESGLITYQDGTSAVIILYVPPRTPEHERDIQSTRVKDIINSLYGDYSFQFISNSIIDYKNPLLQSTTEAMKTKNTPVEITTHIHSLYQEAKDKKEDVDVEFKMIVYIPKTEKVTEAEQLRSAFIPGVLTSLTRASFDSRELTDRNEVIRNMRD